MKKLALFMALVLCLVPVLGACGANSSPEKVATTAFEAMYIDFDYETFFETNYLLDLQLLEDVMGESKDYEDLKTAMREDRDDVKEEIKSSADSVEDSDEIEDYDVEYDVRYVMEYEKDSDMYDLAMLGFEFKGTDYEDLVEEIAVVGIAAERYVTDGDGNEIISGDYLEIVCFNIDGDWYVGELD